MRRLEFVITMLAALMFLITPCQVFAVEILEPVYSPAPFIPSSATDSPQPDTIQYDDIGTGSYRFTAPTNIWSATRFSPLDSFEVRSVYIHTYNPNNITDTITIYAVNDSMVGTNQYPRMSDIIAQVRLRVPNGDAWIDTSFTRPFVRAGFHDFWIVYGCLLGGANGTTTGPWAFLDQTPDNQMRSWYTTGTAVPTGGGWGTISGYDWRCRVGGEYRNLRYVDLHSEFLYNASRKFHFANVIQSQQYYAIIHNIGTDTVNNYIVGFIARDSLGNTVWSTNVNRTTRILPGARDTVAAGALFTSGTARVYSICDTVLAAGDISSINNSSYLEQYVYDPLQPYSFRYDDGQISVNLNMDNGTGAMVRYKPDRYPCMLDSVIIMNGTQAFTARIYIYSDSGETNPTPRYLLSTQTNVQGGATARTAIAVTPVTIGRGSFYVGIIGDATLSIGLNSNNPIASKDTVMGWQRYAGRLTGNTPTWTADYGSDFTIRADVQFVNDRTLSLSHPNGGEVLFLSTVDTVQWTSNDTGTVTVKYNNSYPTGMWVTLANNVRASQGRFVYTVPAPASTTVRFAVITNTLPIAADTSDMDVIIRSPSLRLTRPNGGEVFWTRTVDSVRWGGNLPDSVTIKMNTNYPTGTWTTLARDVPAMQGSYGFMVPVTATNSARFAVISNVLPVLADSSDSNVIFRVPTITLITPHGGETFTIGRRDTIIWASAGVTGNVRIDLCRSYPDTTNWTTIVTGALIQNPTGGWYPWVTTAPATTTARIRVVSLSDTTVRGMSAANFSIAANSANENITEIPTEFSIQSAYPNPFNSTITFNIGVPKNSEVKLLVYNMLGQQVAAIHSGQLSTGYHRFEWNANGVASGNYLVKMVTPGNLRTELIQLIK